MGTDSEWNPPNNYHINLLNFFLNPVNCKVNKTTIKTPIDRIKASI